MKKQHNPKVSTLELIQEYINSKNVVTRDSIKNIIARRAETNEDDKDLFDWMNDSIVRQKRYASKSA